MQSVDWYCKLSALAIARPSGRRAFTSQPHAHKIANGILQFEKASTCDSSTKTGIFDGEINL